MIQKITKKFFVAMLALLLIGVNVLAYGAGGMKDIELTPDKIANTGNVIKLFPSIANTQATVHFWFDADGFVTMQVFDIQGRVVANDEGSILKAHTIETQIDATALQNGTYFVRLSHSNGTVQTSKFVVAH